MTDPPSTALAKQLFNETWDLLDRSDRSPAEDLLMLADALGSAALWRRVDDPRRHAISDWQISRVFAVLGDADWATRFARSGLDLCRTHDLGAFLEGYAWESEARAAHLAGDTVRRDEAIAAAHAAAARIADATERGLLESDLAELAG
jgi:hypothetical protein